MKRFLVVYNITVLLVVIAADQITKSFFKDLIDPLWQFTSPLLSVRLIPSLNSNLAFSIPVSPIALTIIIGSVFLIVAALWIKRMYQQYPDSLWIALILGGGIGNIFDRIRLGGVVDWIEVVLFSFSWSSFNLADTAIVIGVLGWIATSIHSNKQTKVAP